jgi:putative membrane protein
MRFLPNGIFATLALVLCFASMAIAQTATAPPAYPNSQPMSTGGVPTADHKFMTKAAQGGMAEVQLGQLAQQNAQSQAVKDFGQRMVNDHTKANDELKQLASQKGVSLPDKLDPQDEATKMRLSSLKGEAFDRAYMNDMVKDHKKDVAEFKHESTAGQDPQVKDWASKTVPTLASHLQEAEQIAPTVGANKPSAMNSSSTGGTSPQQ